MGEPRSGGRGHSSDKRGKNGANPVNARRRVDSEANEVSGAIRLRSNRPSEARGSISWFCLFWVSLFGWVLVWVLLLSSWVFIFAQSKLYPVLVVVNRLFPLFRLDIRCPVFGVYLTDVISPPLIYPPLRV